MGRLAMGLVVITTAVVTMQPQSVRALPWTRVEAVPASDVFSLQHQGTTLYVGTATIVYIGANEGLQLDTQRAGRFDCERDRDGGLGGWRTVGRDIRKRRLP
jgi:hypothetical protein